MKKRANRNEVVGWVGMSLIVLAYLLVSLGVLAATSAWYQVLNLFGALGIIWLSYQRRIMQTLVLNMFWGAIALVALAGMLL